MISLVLASVCVAIPTCSSVVLTNCATPTPMVQWDPVVSSMLAGYELFARTGGANLQMVSHLDCEWADLDEDGVFDTRLCRGADFSIPVQRHCPGCADGVIYELAVKAYDLLGVRSAQYSPTITICMPPLYQIGSHLPYN